MRDNTDADATTSETGHHADEHHPAHRPFHWRREELLALAIALATLVVWVGATALFGFGGFIAIALLLVAATFVVLVTISLG